jgi:hypothetical protein
MDAMTALCVIFIAALSGFGLMAVLRVANDAVALLREIRNLLQQGVSYGKT